MYNRLIRLLNDKHIEYIENSDGTINSHMYHEEIWDTIKIKDDKILINNEEDDILSWYGY